MSEKVNSEEQNLQCCINQCEMPLDTNFWEQKYQNGETGWDLQSVSPPLKAYIDTIQDKNIAILIPGAGNAYEADYLLSQGFTNITIIDIAPTPIQALKNRWGHRKELTLIQGDFFQYEGKYDLILEQTFFCAIAPLKRVHYLAKIHALLKENGKVVGLLFDKYFEKGPPFGGSKKEYTTLFQHSFHNTKMETCYNSVVPRMGSELFFIQEKNSHVVLSHFVLKGVTCNTCANNIQNIFLQIQDIHNVHINTAYNEILIVSNRCYDTKEVNTILQYCEEYSVEEMN